MGQQQLLLLVLSVIIVGIAVVIGIVMFNDSAASANLDSVSSDLLHLGSRAQQWYARPTAMGGGGNSFTGLQFNYLASYATSNTTGANENGTYTLSVGDQLVTLVGTGKRNGDNIPGNCQATLSVYPDSVHMVIDNR